MQPEDDAYARFQDLERGGVVRRDAIVFFLGRTCDTEIVLYELDDAALADFRAGKNPTTVAHVRAVDGDTGAPRDMHPLRRMLLEFDFRDMGSGFASVTSRLPGLRSLDAVVDTNVSPPAIHGTIAGTRRRLVYGVGNYWGTLPCSVTIRAADGAVQTFGIL